MDFTSDSKLGSQSLEPSVPTSTSGLDPDQEHLLELQDRRDALLSQRQALWQEVERLQQQQQQQQQQRVKEKDSSTNEFSGQIDLLDLAELVPGGEATQPAVVVTQDGSTEVHEELRFKHDCLPLLNMDVRLQYLREMYSYASLELQVSSSTLHVKFHRMAQDPFQVELKLPTGPATVSENLRWTLGPLERCSNPTAVLQGCYEFDRLRCRRQELFEQISTMAVTRGISSRISGSLLSMERNTLTLQLRFTIEIKEHLVLPSTQLWARLFKEGVAVTSPDVQTVLEGLMQEYGVLQGMLELCKTCFT